ncbi:Hypothetical protein Cul210932_1000 [Corynebacterium ulcerans]|uniref:Uncharacterized protein n=1 Tax=Corynebacterium ulcerans FRC58 TaxID=1408268 RepID=A0ABN4GYD3_CORUL|nr:Hypothetical protein Cul210932_1000 [Corynebacterium ulcerans]AIU91601.1 Hypothetical protein Cul05146_1026 [Corynebacterium ulcerans]AKN76894.1 Hypothetical protein CulFRC58_1040 [Corynebacterium ulcerans FRC58]ALD94732.1 Hypothetical protein Cul131001_1020 [Corynebacterium ulcerans]
MGGFFVFYPVIRWGVTGFAWLWKIFGEFSGKPSNNPG